MKILSLDIQNVLRLTAVNLELDPKNNLVIIGGNNAQGKSSVLNSIMAAFGGKKEHMPEMLHKGARKGKVTVTTDDYTITQTFTKEGGGTLTVTAADGKPVTSPQSLLSGFLNSMTFDPLAFMTSKPQEQAAILRQLAGLDFTPFDRDYTATFDERTQINREAKRLDAQLAGMPARHADAPEAEVSIAALSEQLRLEHDKTTAHDRAVQAFSDASRAAYAARELVDDLRARLAVAETEAKAAGEAQAKAKAALDNTQPGNTEPIQAQILSAEDTNRKVRQNAERARIAADLKATTKQADALTAKLEGIRDAKDQAIREAKFPVPGIGFDDDGVTLNGLPVCQASGAEGLRLSVAVGASLNPKLRTMLVRDGSLLDDDNLALLAKLAEEYDFQIFMERVGKRDAMAIIIEDGMVLSESATGEQADLLDGAA